jgi:GDP-mannose 6-dehydrogenase
MAACLAHSGHTVIGVDTNATKVELMNEGRCLIVEPGLDPILMEENRAGRLRATTDPIEAVQNSDVSFICVGTPSLRAGRLGLESVEGVSEQLGAALAMKGQWHTIAVRSTVLPGTIESTVIPIIERVSRKNAEQNFAVCSNPEFIREGTAVEDFFNPPFTILGAMDSKRLKPIRDIYDSVPGKVFETSIRGAEMVKYACNAFHAVKIDFANEIGSLARELDVDPHEVMDIVCADTKLNISRKYLRPGFAFGGSCLPKDISALTHCAKQRDLVLPLLQSVLPSNRAHIDRALELILGCGKRTVGFLGLSFKSGTDDLRESAPLYLIKRLLGEGCQILIYDRSVSRSFIHGANRRFAETEIPHIFSLLRSTLNEVIKESEVIVVGNDDAEYMSVPEKMSPGQQLIDLVEIRWPSRPAATVVDHTPEELEALYPNPKRA